MPARTAARLSRLEAAAQAWEVAACGSRSLEGLHLHEQRQNALCDRLDDNDWDDVEIDALIAAMQEQANLVNCFVGSGMLPRECDLLWYDRLGDLLLTARELRLPMLRLLADRVGSKRKGGGVEWVRKLGWGATSLPAGLSRESATALLRLCIDHAEELDNSGRCAGCGLYWPIRKQLPWRPGFEPQPPRLPEFMERCPHCGGSKWNWGY